MIIKRTIGCLLLFSSIASAQLSDDAYEPGYHRYSSFGFNASSVSGLGLSYRNHFQGPSLVQFTAGILSSGGTTSTALGFGYQYQLSKKDSFRYYIATGLGFYSSTSSTTVFGVGIGLEVPAIGTTIFESVTIGGELFYPAFYLSGSQTIAFGGSFYIYYNF